MVSGYKTKYKDIERPKNSRVFTAEYKLEHFTDGSELRRGYNIDSQCEIHHYHHHYQSATFKIVNSLLGNSNDCVNVYSG